MRHSVLLEQMLKRPLLLAVVATFAAAGCSTTQPVAQSPDPSPPKSYVGPAGPDGPAGPVGKRGATGATGGTFHRRSDRSCRSGRRARPERSDGTHRRDRGWSGR